jgi:hypothetical protein
MHPGDIYGRHDNEVILMSHAIAGGKDAVFHRYGHMKQ